MVQNSEHFSPLQKGSEWNSESFLFRGTAGIPPEQTICPVNSVFRGIIFLSEIANPYSFPTSHPPSHFSESWAFAHFFEVRYPLPTQFFLLSGSLTLMRSFFELAFSLVAQTLAAQPVVR
jgi:hypothetical protein